MKTGTRNIFTCFLILGLFISCRKNEVNIQNQKNKIVVLAEITAGDSAIIPVSKSIEVGTNASIAFDKLATASVEITDTIGNTSTLHWNNTADFLNNPSTIFTNPVLFKPNESYTLQVSQAGLESATASAHIPQSFSVQNVNTVDGEHNGKDVLGFNFTILDNANEKDYYLFEAVKQLVYLRTYFYWQGVKYDYNTTEGQNVYDQASSQQNIPLFKDTVLTNKYQRLNLYTSDVQTDNEDFTSLDSSFHRIFLTDSLFNGNSYTTSFAIDKTYFEAQVPEQKGRILVQIKSVSKELFDYLSQYEKYRTEFGILPPANLLSPPGNINGGYGVFGGSYKNQWVYYYDEL
ncbi:MAG: DUF4249 domain-containing protein [Ginsengibacter sp.]